MDHKETNGNGRPVLKGGVYKHPESGQELIAVQTAKFGNPQADAYVRMGYQYAREATQEELYGVVDPTTNETPIDLANRPKTVAELETELAAAKAREAQNQEKTEAARTPETTSTTKEKGSK